MCDKVCGIDTGDWSRELQQIEQYLDLPESLLVVLKQQGNIALLSRTAQAILARNEADLIGKNWFETCVAAHDRAQAWASFQEALNNDDAVSNYFEYSIIGQSGEERIIVWRRHRILDANGNCIAILAAGEDVTERRKAEQSLKKSEALFRGIVETSPDAIAVIDPEGRYLMLSRSSGERTLEQNIKQMQQDGVTCFDMVSPESRATAAAMLRQIVQNGGSMFFELNVLRSDDTCFPAEIHASLLRDAEGKPNSIILMVRDITERKRAEEELRQSEIRFRDVSEAAGEYVWEISRDNIYTFVSDRITMVTGYSVEELLGHSPVEFMTPEDAIRAKATVIDATARHIPFHFEFHDVAKDGEVVWIASHGIPLYDSQNRHIGFRGASADITERKKAEEELRKTKRQAVAANRTKAEFLANVSHELRTPMTAILGFTDLLLNNALSPEEQREFLATIRKNGKSLLSLIDNVLDLSKLETEKMTVDFVDCSLQETLETPLKMGEQFAAKKGLKFSVQQDPSLPRIIHTDPIRLRQILANLVGNAVKFTDRGEIHVVLQQRRQVNGTAHLHCTVSDTGVGIARDKLAEVFEPFTQADNSTTRRHGGSGLGLAISKRLAQMLGGDITVSSELGRGSVFALSVNISMPATAPAVSAHGGSPNAQTQTRSTVIQGRVLLVEDNPDVQNLLRRILQGMKLDADVAANGRIACEAAEKSRSCGWPYDLILMDIQMPEMDGYQATGWLREHGWKGPIVALTAHAMREDRQKCLAAGCDEYLAKPVQLKTLRDMVSNFIPRGSKLPTETVSYANAGNIADIVCR